MGISYSQGITDKEGVEETAHTDSCSQERNYIFPFLLLPNLEIFVILTVNSVLVTFNYNMSMESIILPLGECIYSLQY